MRVFTATLGTETNTFAPLPTGLASFQGADYDPAGIPTDRLNPFAMPMRVARERAASDGWTVIEGMVAFAMPAGVTTRHAYEFLRDRAARRPARRDAGRHGAARAARRDGRRRLRRRRGRPAGAGARDGRARHGDRRGARPALPPDRGQDLERRRAGALQGVSAHRHVRAGAGPGEALRGDGAGPDPAGDVGFRLRDDHHVPHQPRADARLRRPDQGARGARRRAVGVDRARLPVGRRAGRRDARPRDHRRPGRRGRGARRAARPRARRHARPAQAGLSGPRRGDRRRARDARCAGRARRFGRQPRWRRRGRLDLRAARTARAWRRERGARSAVGSDRRGASCSTPGRVRGCRFASGARSGRPRASRWTPTWRCCASRAARARPA